MHPYSSKREYSVGHNRAKAFIRAAGGRVHSDAAADTKLVGKMIRSHAAKEHGVHGLKRGGRLDKFQRGGAAKKKHGTQVNIAVVAPHGRDHGAPAGGPPPGGAPPPMPPAPPMGGPPMPPPGMGMGAPPGLPPRGPMMKRGGKVKKFQRGGVAAMPALPAQAALAPGLAGGMPPGLASAPGLATAPGLAGRMPGRWQRGGKAGNGKLGGGMPQKGGAETGQGRLDKAKGYRKNR